MRYKILLLLVFVVAAQLPARANDSTARVGTGGLTLIKNNEIRMIEEELEISAKKIHVRYRFLNESKRDLHETVAFPMPSYGWNPGESAFDSNEKPLTSFKVLANGQLISVKKQKRAVIGTKDVTSQLRKIGLSESQIFETFGNCNIDSDSIKCGLTKSQISKITSLSGASDPYKAWKVAETAFWELSFPAGREIEVIHEYVPFVGEIYTYPFQKGYGFDNKSLGAANGNGAEEACVADGAQQELNRRVKKIADSGASVVSLWLKDVEYILGTGRNWKGPIKQFKLRVIKELPEDLVSLCFPGKAVKINPTTLEFSRTDFVPQDKLIIYYYSLKTEQ